MMTEIFSFELDASVIAGASLWSLALYLGFSSLTQWMMEQLNHWFDIVHAWLYKSAEEFERNRKSKEAQSALYASLLSIVPFLVVGGLCNYGVELSLGRSWAVSIGILACMGCGVYELGRRSGQSE
jgi:hypothetical protein